VAGPLVKLPTLDQAFVDARAAPVPIWRNYFTSLDAFVRGLSAVLTVVQQQLVTGFFVSTTFGYGPAGQGIGGSVVQATSKSTAVTLNKVTGSITTSNASLAVNAAVSFQVNDSLVGAADTVVLNLASGAANGQAYTYEIAQISAGSFVVAMRNLSAGALAEALTFNFSVIKGQNT
jgi:hypothetical protein